ncbi:MAG: hypothetical protein A3G39_07915 [Deltaproteobacteria bacterium RIFCSPLOWO2_12_FULL_43_16]|nr:MAG: hypothetical protein A2Z89_06945 [Deltaproteobacteria bacterium GWA2_43_19]OGQ09490.1 MAG: hypothetical protein A3D30_06745 [Deltaproteobacteria bacterium RIFCSPHIGHO2_02_FULL_43_33]OGQ37507.1 MAG: hypothetical protein A3A85_05565 [Deltaproteobacteria bacterium RIFCSPLOWO2_01_FULL_42_9]OGQ57898.1 MAG: hypothetical protein A3G39_07915 [Deltaproteobacteria bacterium RIFCSPLOWO2_12_FULL_43_16]HBR17911.1 hypothetical protein [Deltaproteobacteria bacterium]
MKKKLIIFISLLFFCFAFVLPDNIYAGANVTVYISVGVVVGGASLFFSLAFSEKVSQNKEKPSDGEEVYFSAIDSLKFQGFQNRDDDIPDLGRVKLLSW